MSQFGHSAPLASGGADPLACTPPQPSSVYRWFWLSIASAGGEVGVGVGVGIGVGVGVGIGVGVGVGVGVAVGVAVGVGVVPFACTARYELPPDSWKTPVPGPSADTASGVFRVH